MIGLIITIIIIAAIVTFNSDSYNTLTEYLGKLITLLFKIAAIGILLYIFIILPSSYLYHC